MKTRTSLLMACLIGLSFPVCAEVQKFGDVEINYNVVTTDTLSPKVAKAYGISRSKNRMLLTVVVTRPDGGGIPRPVSADVTAQSVNMIQQQRPIRMRSINEGEAIYYIGDFGFTSPDFMRFTLNIAEAGAASPYKIEFQRNFERY
ncbi:MAG: DUF4426 domain-containing protein [Sulfuricella denitrificans]|nr:DUF4426 domain-containing protein [Sulfuricella denitrificans]